MELSAIGQIAITAHDIDRAIAFYRDVLKLKHLFSFPRMAFFDCGGVRLMLAIPETPALDHPSSIIYFKVADIHAGYRELVSHGVHFEAAPDVVARIARPDLWVAEVRGSESKQSVLVADG